MQTIYRLPVIDPLVLPPWGVLNKKQREELGTRRAPNEWLSVSPLSQDQKEADWQEWFRKTLDLIADALWPVYDVTSRCWLGRSAEHMLDLTSADLRIMNRVQARRELEKIPEAKFRSPDCPNHFELFRAEDSEVFTTLRFYNSTVNAEAESKIRSVCVDGVINKHLPVTLAFKHYLQRPRAMQTAILYLARGFEFFNSCTSQTPSMISGHAIQALAGVAAVLDANLSNGVTISPDLEECIADWGVDIGERRMLAGVHYPSDNLASWIVFFSMFDKVYRYAHVKKVMAEAIMRRSVSFREIMAEVECGCGTVYGPAIEELLLLMPSDY